MSTTTAPPPDYVVDRDERTNVVTDRMTRVFKQWLLSVTGRIEQSARTILSAPVVLSAQNASVGVTPIPTAPLAAGFYRVSTFARVTTAAGVSSSLSVTITFVHGGLTCTQSWDAALTGNTTSSTKGQVFTIAIDAASPISYSTVYASNGPGEMQYALTVALELVQ